MTYPQNPLGPRKLYSRTRILMTGFLVMVLMAVALRIEWKPVLESMTMVRPAWLLGGIGFSSLAVLLRGFRLALVSGSSNRFGQGWRAFSVGYAGNLVLPLGSGELLKVATFRKLAKLSFTHATASIFMDRILDVVGMLSVLLAFLSLGGTPVFNKGPLISLFTASALLLAIIAALAWHGHRLRTWFEHQNRERAHPRVEVWLTRFDHLHDQSMLLRAPGRLLPLLLLQTCIVLIDALATWLSLKAFPFGANTGLTAAFRLNLFLNAAAALPLLPGGLGAHQVACVLAMRPYGWNQAQSLALSILGQGITFLWLLLQGLTALLTAPSGLLQFSANPTEDPP